MDTGTQSSFIPKEAGSASTVKRSMNVSAGLPELMMLAATIVLVASGALAGGVFLYQQFLQRQTVSKAEQLKRAEAAFEPALIQQLTRLDERMHTAETLLSAHLAPSVFFDSLNQATLTTVSFANLTLDAIDQKQITIKMSGIAKSVNSVAFQANLFGKNSVITDPIFSKIDQQQDSVHFDLVALVNSSAISYTQLIGGIPVPTVLPPPQPETPGSVFTTPPNGQETTTP